MSGSEVMNCPACAEARAAEDYVTGALSPVERDRFEEHFFDCPVCAEAIRDLSSLQVGVRTGLCPTAVSTLRTRSRRVVTWLQPSAAAAAILLAVFFGYQNVQLRSQLQPVALHSVVLQPATRSDASLPTVQSGGPFALLEADLPGASGNLSWSLSMGAGDAVMNGSAQAPEPGLLFKVLLPSSELPPADYLLTVQSDAGKTWRFRFRTAAP